MGRRRMMLGAALAGLATAVPLTLGCGGGGAEAEAPAVVAETAEASTTTGGTTGEGVKPEADFTLVDGWYVSIDEVKRELDRGADFILLDERPPSDFEYSHITGAISVPYYEVEKHLAELPKDSDEFLFQAIARGRPETKMSAWSADLGGPLEDGQIQELVDFIRGWQTAPALEVENVRVDGSPVRGREIFEAAAPSATAPMGREAVGRA